MPPHLQVIRAKAPDSRRGFFALHLRGIFQRPGPVHLLPVFPVDHQRNRGRGVQWIIAGARPVFGSQ
jgi:hypothetical protein